MAENDPQRDQRRADMRSLMIFAVIFFIVITLATLIPVPPALVGCIFAFVLGGRYMRSSLLRKNVSIGRCIFLGTVCGCGALIALLVLHATILSFLPRFIVFLAAGTALAFWIGNALEYGKIAPVISSDSP